MINEIQLYSTFSGQSIDFHQRYGATYILQTVDLGVVQASHKTYEYINQVGVYVTGSTLQTRDINIIGYVAGKDNNELRQKRELLNTMINPLHLLELRLQDDYLITLLPKTSINYSTEYEENNEVYCRYLITGFCPDPLFYLSSTSSVLLAYTIPYFHFELIIPQGEGIIFGLREPSQIGEVVNRGDVYTGMRITFRAKGTLINPSLTDLTTQEYIKINKTMEPNEVIVVNTQEGNKYVQGTLGGVTSNYYQYRDLNSSWLQLRPGANLFQYSAEENVVNLEVTIQYNTRFLEVE